MEEERKKKKKKENPTELQKPNIGAEVYDNNKKCDRKKKLKRLIRFHTDNKITTTTDRGKWRKRKEKKNPKEFTEQVKT